MREEGTTTGARGGGNWQSGSIEEANEQNGGCAHAFRAGGFTRARFRVCWIRAPRCTRLPFEVISQSIVLIELLPIEEGAMVHRPVRFHLLYSLLDLHFHSSLSGDEIGWRAFGNSNPKLWRSTLEPSPSHPGANTRREHPRIRIRRKENKDRAPVYAGAVCAASAGGALCACASSMRSSDSHFRNRVDPPSIQDKIRSTRVPKGYANQINRFGHMLIDGCALQSRRSITPAAVADTGWRALVTLAAARATCSMVTAFGARPTVADTARNV